MFENCNNITELNKMRAELIRSKEYSTIEINNAYNKRRNELGSISQPSTSLKTYKPVTRTFPRVYTIPIIYGNDFNLIKLTKEGFVI